MNDNEGGVGILPSYTTGAIFKVKQTVVRTRTKAKGYAYESRAFEELKSKLAAGWCVVMCSRIGDELEYILQKYEVQEGENDGR